MDRAVPRRLLQCNQRFMSPGIQDDGYWTDTVQKNPFFTVTADTGISVPDNSSFPVEVLAPEAVSQEKTEELICHFAGDMNEPLQNAVAEEQNGYPAADSDYE